VDNEFDQTIVKMAYERDQELIADGTVEPSFIRGLYRKNRGQIAYHQILPARLPRAEKLHADWTTALSCRSNFLFLETTSQQWPR
jgi:hypothetical protein